LFLFFFFRFKTCASTLKTEGLEISTKVRALRPRSQYHFSVIFLFLFRSPSLFYLPVHSRCRGCLYSLDHTQTHTTVGSTPLDEGSARRRDLYLTTQTLYETNIHAPCGIRTHDPNKRWTADLGFRPRGHWDRRC
jgi:hypothetical protein